MNFFLSSKTFSYYIPQIWLQVKKIQPLLFAQGSCLKERIGRQIRGASWTNSWEVACHFEYNFLNFDHQFFFIIQKMYFRSTTNLITSQKNQPLLFAQGGCLEENLKANKRGTLKKYTSKIFTSYIPQIWLQVRKIYPYYLYKVA